MQKLVALVLFFVVFACNARTVLWTSAGGNPLWSTPGNWDCNCLPTENDDVIIDIQAINGYVQIGDIKQTAVAKSLTIGGTSRFRQTLVVTSALTIGTGGGALNSGGEIKIQSSPNAPVIVEGQFVSRGGAFSFETGTLGGPGSFVFPTGTLLNFTGPASKAISTMVKVQGSAIVDSSTGTSLQISRGGRFLIEGSFKTTSNLIVTTDNTSTFAVMNQGTFTFLGQTLSIDGEATLANWVLGPSSQTTLVNAVTSGTLAMTNGAQLILIGSPTLKRQFTTITGQGTIYQQGGYNTFGSIEASILTASGGTAVVVNKAIISTFTLGGGDVVGKQVNAEVGVLTSGNLGLGITVSVNSLTISGIVGINDDGTSVTVNKNGQVTTASQLTFHGASYFVVASTAYLTQHAALKIVTADTATSYIRIAGVWRTTNADVSIFTTRVNGNGVFMISSGCSLSLTSLVFDLATIENNGTLSLSSSSVNVTTVNGTGNIVADTRLFEVKNVHLTGTLTLTSGNAQFQTGAIQNVLLNGGTLYVQSAVTVGKFAWAGGSLTGQSPSNSKLVVDNTVITSTTSTLTHITLNTRAITLACNTNCQFFTKNAFIQTV